MRFYLFLVLLLGSFSSLNANFCLTSSEANFAIDIPNEIRNDKGITYKQIAKIISEQYQGDSLRARAIFMWVAGNIHYDLKNMSRPSTYESRDQMVEEVLKTRKGVCIHYAELFSKIANEIGIKTYVISGYTIQNGKIDQIAHAWCGSLIENQWYIFDPTWGGGYLEKNKYKKEINEYYCQMSPETSIKSHFPFDPFFQFRDANDFSCADSLYKYERSSEIDQLNESNRRIIQNGITNKLIQDKLSYNINKIKTIKNNIAIDEYNESVLAYNQAIDLLNQLIKEGNQNLLSNRDKEIRHSQIKSLLEEIKEKNLGIKAGNSDMAKSIKQLSKSIDQALINLQRLK